MCKGFFPVAVTYFRADMVRESHYRWAAERAQRDASQTFIKTESEKEKDREFVHPSNVPGMSDDSVINIKDDENFESLA